MKQDDSPLRPSGPVLHKPAKKRPTPVWWRLAKPILKNGIGAAIVLLAPAIPVVGEQVVKYQEIIVAAILGSLEFLF